MFGAVEDVDCVRDKVRDGFERFHRASWAPGEIDNQRFAACHSNAAGEDGGGSFLQAFAANLFGDTRKDALGDGLSGFGGVVTRADASAAGCGDEIDPAGVGQLAEIFADRRGIVGDSETRGDFPMETPAESDHCRA